MFARLSALLLAVPLLVSATAVPRGGGRGGNIGNQCSTGTLQCCNSLHSIDDTQVAPLAGLLQGALGPISGQLGLTCTPVSVLAAGSNSCTQQTACCDNNQFNGLVVVGCSPINLSL